MGFWDRDDALEYVDKLDKVTRSLWAHDDRLVYLRCCAAQDARENKTNEKTIKKIEEAIEIVKGLEREKKELEELMFPKR